MASRSNCSRRIFVARLLPAPALFQSRYTRVCGPHHRSGVGACEEVCRESTSAAIVALTFTALHPAYVDGLCMSWVSPNFLLCWICEPSP
ncbi:hypothetical protein KC19_10G075800 [Ceratodon purpureus]|uniref:Uncharacterized protein n=1 Tax=Ceratodon purpureus TaxID=3225 RepID=A0A8T0GLG8_CERPU|nr:hypothetical protein KC19_10G075800 [Ceratodon purpureus]